MESLQLWLDNSSTPLISAFILGLMTAISPCPLATNITAVAFISKDIENRQRAFANGIIYTLGRAFSYSAIGIVLFFGASQFQMSKLFAANGQRFLGPLLIIIGILMLDLIPFKFPSFGKLNEKFRGKDFKNSSFNVLLLGIVFALAFCPYSGVLYFGMLIPMSIASPSGLYLPLIYAVGTGIPVIIAAYILTYSISGIGNFYNKIQSFYKWFNRIAAILFIAAGLYYVFSYYL
jgi:cytochrome c-type biogenesis protein